MENSITPFLKWAGGKRWLVNSEKLELPENFNNYYEPFLGGGAMFLKLAPERAFLSDLNSDLINAYVIMRDHPEKLEKKLAILQVKHNKEFYYWMRKQVFEEVVDQAAQFIYLNRTCWNGLYRVNLKGNFNVPIGTKTKVLLESDNFIETSRRLSKVELKVCDFEKSIDKAIDGDFIFVDPPYTVQHNLNGFIKYNETLFSWSDQKRLQECLLKAKSRGANILLTNANHESIRDLFYEIGKYTPVSRTSVLAGNSSYRGRTTEATFCSWL